ncbi:hypothetical protein IV454_21835 [Massilia antarctica]|uniref:Uncharacterized protein n=1 Tax=Massilia antarctica TaxID=2765360 RepID=A0AA48WA49_9BURK|nr:hypothetical protein [Massilia antarctica]QPI48171.1 hypothetical protein IV454_21835 [Massilia antarctica]
MSATDLDYMLNMAMLIGVILLLSRVGALTERLKKIETLLLTLPVDKTALDLSPEVKQLIAEGHKNKAMALHRKQTESSGRSAQTAVEDYIAREAISTSKV